MTASVTRLPAARPPPATRPASPTLTPTAADRAARARTSAKRYASTAAFEALSLGTQFVARLRELEGIDRTLLPVSVVHDAPLTAARLEADIQRWTAALRSDTGRIG